jgi:hypothetical protein
MWKVCTNIFWKVHASTGGERGREEKEEEERQERFGV